MNGRKDGGRKRGSRVVFCFRGQGGTRERGRRRRTRKRKERESGKKKQRRRRRKNEPNGETSLSLKNLHRLTIVASCSLAHGPVCILAAMTVHSDLASAACMSEGKLLKGGRERAKSEYFLFRRQRRNRGGCSRRRKELPRLRRRVVFPLSLSPASPPRSLSVPPNSYPEQRRRQPSERWRSRKGGNGRKPLLLSKTASFEGEGGFEEFRVERARRVFCPFCPLIFGHLVVTIELSSTGYGASFCLILQRVLV